MVATLPMAADAPIECPIRDLVALMAIFSGTLAKEGFNRAGFNNVTKGRGSSMCVDIFDGVGFARPASSIAASMAATWPLRSGMTICAGVACLSEARKAGVYFRTSALACSFFSSMRMPAPSDMTKPSRPLANGLDAPVGSCSSRWLRRAIFQNPFIVSGSTHASAPPAITASARPVRRRSSAHADGICSGRACRAARQVHPLQPISNCDPGSG